MAFLVATMSLPAVYLPNGYARTTTTGMPHASANNQKGVVYIGHYQLKNRVITVFQPLPKLQKPG